MNKVNAILYFKEFMHGVSKVRAKLGSLCIICSLGQVKFSCTLWPFICPCASIKFCNFHTPVMGKYFCPHSMGLGFLTILFDPYMYLK